MQLNGGYVNGMPYINHGQAQEPANFFGNLGPNDIPPGRAFTQTQPNASFINYGPYPHHQANSGQPYGVVGQPVSQSHYMASPHPSPNPADHSRLHVHDGASSRASSQSHSRSPRTEHDRLPPISQIQSPPIMSQPRYPDAGPFLREQFNIPDDLEVNLYALPDPDNNEVRPPYTLHDLAKLAIYGHPRHKASLHEIRAAIQQRYPFFEGKNQKKFCGSIRHLLSFHSVFAKLPRRPTEPGHGEYWTLDVEHAYETKRPRKRRNTRGKLSTSQSRVRKPLHLQGRDQEEESSSRSSSSSRITPTPEPESSSGLTLPRLPEFHSGRADNMASYGYNGVGLAGWQQYGSQYPSPGSASSPFSTPYPEPVSEQRRSPRHVRGRDHSF